MPIYEYYCLDCDSIVERNVPMVFRDDQYCHCGFRLLRQWSVGGIVIR